MQQQYTPKTTNAITRQMPGVKIECCLFPLRIVMNKTFLTLAFILCAATLQAQSPVTFIQKQDIPVLTANGPLPSPWAGGLNTPQFSTIDLNKDGVQDLFAFDRILKKVFTWLAVQENGTWKYTYKPEYELLFPATLHEWVLLRDFNCDGLKDIFTSDPQGIKVYRQLIGEDGLPAFVEEAESINYESHAGLVNMQMLGADVPAITDMDNDGDLDILLSDFSVGQNLEYYQNMQTERGLSCGELKFINKSKWWGSITECTGCNNYVFGAACRVAGPMHSGHDGTSLLLLDMDADGDKDLLSGGVACNELLLMENKGTVQEARMESMELVFPANTRQASFHKFPAAYYEDVTFDGVPDLLVAPSTGHTNGDAISKNSVWLYRNKGVTDKPLFEFVQEDFLQEQMLDMGEGAYPAFADLDGDGDLDMLIGNNGSMYNLDFKASVSYFQNTGTTTAPEFTWVTDDYLNLKSQNLLAVKPAFADLNGDAVTDLILTYRLKQAGTNRVSYLPNTAAKGAAMVFDRSQEQSIKPLADGDSPAFSDADNDGDQDFLVGRANGDLQLYLNKGSITVPDYVLSIANLGGISADFAKGNLYPAVADIDGDDAPDLLTTDNSGELKVYTNFLDKLNATLKPTTYLLVNELAATEQATRFGKELSVTPVVFGEKGRLRLFIGSLGGGLVMLEQSSGNSKQPAENPLSINVLVYPNPAFRESDAGVQVNASEPVTLVMFDALGRQVYSSSTGFRHQYRLDVSRFQAGMYFLRATARNGNVKTTKLVLL